MFTETDTGTRFSIEIPIEVSTFWFFGAWLFVGLLVFVIAFVFTNAIPRTREDWKEESSAKKSWLTRFLQWMYAENSGMHFVKWLALFAAPFWVFFIGLIIRNFAQLGLNPPTGEDTDPRAYYFAIAGTVALLGGLVAAPLALLRLQTVERQTKAQEEGLITERINKAVASLGAEKTTSKLGRTVSYTFNEKRYAVHQWYGEGDDSVTAPVDASDVHFGDWETFNETEPNLEVRIGAIYALERIARDSLRDHIQIMEILCAYIRENAPASEALELQEPTEWLEGETQNGDGLSSFLQKNWLMPYHTALADIRPRADVQTALTVIGRRSRPQKETEWGDWRPFEDKVPDWPEWNANEDGTAGNAYAAGVEAHKSAVRTWGALKPIYQLDLRATNLRGADMSGTAQTADFSLARFTAADLQGANFIAARVQQADFSLVKAQTARFFMAEIQESLFLNAQIRGADFMNAKAQGAHFSHAQIKKVLFRGASAQWAKFHGSTGHGADFSHTKLQNAYFSKAQVQGANFSLATFDNETTFEAAKLHLAAMKCDLSMVSLSQTQVNSAFGDGETKLPKGIDRSMHWPGWKMEYFSPDKDMSFLDQWRKCKSNPYNYKPPPKPDTK